MGAIFPKFPKTTTAIPADFFIIILPNHQGQPHRRVIFMCNSGYESNEEPTSEIYTKLYKPLVSCDLPKQIVVFI